MESEGTWRLQSCCELVTIHPVNPPWEINGLNLRARLACQRHRALDWELEHMANNAFSHDDIKMTSKYMVSTPNHPLMLLCSSEGENVRLTEVKCLQCECLTPLLLHREDTFKGLTKNNVVIFQDIIQNWMEINGYQGEQKQEKICTAGFGKKWVKTILYLWSPNHMQKGTSPGIHSWTEMCGESTNKTGIQNFLFWFCSVQWSIGRWLVSFPSVTYVVLTDIPVLCVCGSVSAACLQTPHDWQWGFAVKCKKLGADWACLHEVFDVSAISTWVECLFAHSYMYIQMLSASKTYSSCYKAAAAHLKAASWWWLIQVGYFLWLCVCCTSVARYHMQIFPERCCSLFLMENSQFLTVVKNGPTYFVSDISQNLQQIKCLCF